MVFQSKPYIETTRTTVKPNNNEGNIWHKGNKHINDTHHEKRVHCLVR